MGGAVHPQEDSLCWVSAVLNRLRHETQFTNHISVSSYFVYRYLSDQCPHAKYHGIGRDVCIYLSQA